MDTPRNDTTRLDETEGKSAVPAAVEAREDAATDTAGIAQMAPGAQVTRSRLSPLNARRLQSFKANRRGLWSFPAAELSVPGVEVCGGVVSAVSRSSTARPASSGWRSGPPRTV